MGIYPFSTGQFGFVPDAPESECSGDFCEEVCRYCNSYGECKAEEEENERSEMDN